MRPKLDWLAVREPSSDRGNGGGRLAAVLDSVAPRLRSRFRDGRSRIVRREREILPHCDATGLELRGSSQGGARDGIVQRARHAHGKSRDSFDCGEPFDKSRKSDRRKGQGRDGDPGPGHESGAKAGPRMEGRAVRHHRAGRSESAGRYFRRGRDRADLDDADGAVALEHPENLLGRVAGAVGGMSGRRFFRLRMEQVCAGVVAGGLRESRQRVQLLLGNAISQALPDYYDQYCRHGDDTILSNQLCTH